MYWNLMNYIYDLNIVGKWLSLKNYKFKNKRKLRVEFFKNLFIKSNMSVKFFEKIIYI